MGKIELIVPSTSRAILRPHEFDAIVRSAFPCASCRIASAFLLPRDALIYGIRKIQTTDGETDVVAGKSHSSSREGRGSMGRLEGILERFFHKSAM